MDFVSWLFGGGRKPTQLGPAGAPPPVPRTQGDDHHVPAQRLNRELVEELAAQHGVSPGVIEALATALSYSSGRSAQFNHPELGGMGQWMSGGMLMIGDMFNNELKAKVDRLCRAVSESLRSAPTAIEAGESPREISWWPAGLGTPAAAGGQNAMRYAFFPATKRLVIDDNGAVSVYDTGDHYLTGVSQQQSATQTLSFSSSDGPVALASLKCLSSNVS